MVKYFTMVISIHEGGVRKTNDDYVFPTLVDIHFIVHYQYPGSLNSHSSAFRIDMRYV